MNKHYKASPIFVAVFSDGVETRMTVFHEPGRNTFDLVRAMKLSRAGYVTRTQHKRKLPPIVKGCFVDPDTGETLREYDNGELEIAS